jgi:phage terminase large subunit-like protein
VAAVIDGEADLDTVTIVNRDGTDNYAESSHNYKDGDKVDWEGNTITWVEWFDEELINVGGVSVTREDAAIGTTVIIVCCIIAGLICMYISWKKRKEIAAGARASIQIIRRQS